MGCFQGIATICEQPRYDLEHESPITTWDIGAQFFVIVPCRDEAQKGVHGIGTYLAGNRHEDCYKVIRVH